MDEFTKEELQEIKRCLKHMIQEGTTPYSCLTMDIKKKVQSMIERKDLGTTANVGVAIESEKTLLGALLLDSSCYLSIKDMLCVDDFSCEAHQKVFKAIEEMFDEHGTFDIYMVSGHGGLNAGYLYSLAEECCSTANVLSHARIIREKSVQFQLVKVAQEIAEAATQ